MEIETAAQYCARIDFEQGEAWSNDYEKLPIKMQEYAEYYHQAKLKLLGIANVSHQRELLAAFVKDWYKDNPMVDESKQLKMVDKFLVAYSG